MKPHCSQAICVSIDSVLWAVEKGITNGVTDTLFDPDDHCVRAVVVTFLWRAAGKPEPTTSNPFVDVKESDFYYKAVLWAVEEGITKGMDTSHFGPMLSCTRAQAVTFFWRSQNCPASDVQISFPDVEPDAFYTTAVAWAVEKDITNGMNDGTFGVDGVCTRAQVVTFLYRALAK